MSASTAYGGTIAGPIAAWTFCSLLILAYALFRSLFRPMSRSRLLISAISAFWIVHGYICLYTSMQIISFCTITATHLSAAENSREIFLLTIGSVRFFAFSTVSIILTTVICFDQMISASRASK